MKFDKELMKGSTNMIVLSLLQEENMYGYQMIKKLLQKSNNVFELQEGTLYPILHGLEAKKLIKSYWDETTGKRRKYYCITKRGKNCLEFKKNEWLTFSKGINQIIGGELFGC